MLSERWREVFLLQEDCGVAVETPFVTVMKGQFNYCGGFNNQWCRSNKSNSSKTSDLWENLKICRAFQPLNLSLKLTVLDGGSTWAARGCTFLRLRGLRLRVKDGIWNSPLNWDNISCLHNNVTTHWALIMLVATFPHFLILSSYDSDSPSPASSLP